MIPCSVNQPIARAKNPTVVAFCSSARTSTNWLQRTYRCDGQACGVIDYDIHLLLANVSAGAMTLVAGDLMADALKAGQLFGEQQLVKVRGKLQRQRQRSQRL